MVHYERGVDVRDFGFACGAQLESKALGQPTRPPSSDRTSGRQRIVGTGDAGTEGGSPSTEYRSRDGGRAALEGGPRARSTPATRRGLALRGTRDGLGRPRPPTTTSSPAGPPSAVAGGGCEAEKLPPHAAREVGGPTALAETAGARSVNHAASYEAGVGAAAPPPPATAPPPPPPPPPPWRLPPSPPAAARPTVAQVLSDRPPLWGNSRTPRPVRRSPYGETDTGGCSIPSPDFAASLDA